MGLLKVAENADDSLFDDEVLLGDEGVVLVLSLLLPRFKVLEGVNEGMMGVLEDGFMLGLVLVPLTASPALVPDAGTFLNCLRSLNMDDEVFLLLNPLVFVLGGDACNLLVEFRDVLEA